MSIRITIAGWSALVCLLASGCVGWQFQPGSGPSRWSQRTSESPIEAWPGETPGAKAELNARNASQSGSTPTASRQSLTGQTVRRGTTVTPPQADNNQAREAAHPTVTGLAAMDGSPLDSPAAFGPISGGSPANSLRSQILVSGDRSDQQAPGPNPNVFQADRAEPKSADELPPVEAGRLISSVSPEGQLTNRSPVYGSVTDQVTTAAGPGTEIAAPNQATTSARLASAFVPDDAASPAPAPATSAQPVVTDGEAGERKEEAEGEGPAPATQISSEPTPAPESASARSIGAALTPAPASADTVPPASPTQPTPGSRDPAATASSGPPSGSSDQAFSPSEPAQVDKVGDFPAPASLRPNSLRPYEPLGNGQVGPSYSQVSSNLVSQGPVNPVQAGLSQLNQNQAGFLQAAHGQAGIGQAGIGQAGIGQAGIAQAGIAQAGIAQAGIAQAGAGQIGLAQAGFGTATTGGALGSQLALGSGRTGPAAASQAVPASTVAKENPLGLTSNFMPTATGQVLAGQTTTGQTSSPQAATGQAEIGLFTPIPGLSAQGNTQVGSKPASVNPSMPAGARTGPATSASAAAFPGAVGQAVPGQATWGGQMTGPAPSSQPGHRPNGSGSFGPAPTGPGRYGVWPAPGQATNGLGLGAGPAVGTGIGDGRGEPSWNGPAGGPANAAANRPGQWTGELPMRRSSPATPEIEPLSAPVPPSIPLGVTRGQDAGWGNARQPGLPAQQLPPPPASGQPLQTLDGQPLFVNPYPIDPPPSALPYESGQRLPPPLDFDVYVDETRTGRFMFGAGVNSDLGVTGQIVVEERNFDWRAFPTSFSDIVNGTAWRGAGQGFRFEAMPGTQVQRYLVSFTQPYLYLPGIPDPFSLNLSASYFNRNFFDWDEERLGGRVGLGYRLTHDLSLTTSFRAENVKIYNPRVLGNPQLDEVLGNNDIFSGRVGLTHDTRDQPFSPTEGHLIEVSYEQAFGSFDYPRGELDFRQYFLMRERPDGSGRHTLGFSFRASASGSQTPIMERFFAGGFSTLRGFDFRGASPVGVGGVVVGGDFSFLGSVEYMFPLTADDMMRGVVFCDFGTVEENIEFRSENYRVAPGAGLRIAVPALGPAPLALDFAFPVAKAETDQEQIFSFFFGFGR